MTYPIAHINEGYTPIEALATLALQEKPAVQQLLRQHGYTFSGEQDYLRALSDASFDTAFVSDLIATVHLKQVAHWAHAGGGGGFTAGDGFFNAIGGLFNLGGSIATGVMGNKALQAQADAAKQTSADQLQAAYYQLQAVMAGTQSQMSGQLAQVQMTKWLLWGGGGLLVLFFTGLILYKRFT